MKKVIFVLLLVISFGCKKEKAKSEEPTFKIISSDSISLGDEHQIRHSRISNNNFSIAVNYSLDDSIDTHQSVIKLENDGKIINSSKVNFNHSLTDYVECNDGFYTIETLRVTMGKSYTHDFLCKYDNNWNKLWEKELKTEKYPAGNSFISLNKDKSITLISDAKNNNQYGLSIKKLQSNGELVTNSFYSEFSDPLTITTTSEHDILISTFSKKSNYPALILTKINGEILWKSTLNETIIPKQIKQLKDNSFILIGTKYIENSRQKVVVVKLNSKGQIIWKKESSKHYYEEAGNIIISDNNYLITASVNLYKDGESFPYIFKINKDGKLMSEKRFNFELSESSTPLIIKNDKYLTLISVNRIVNSNDPFENYISINRISKTN